MILLAHYPLNLLVLRITDYGVLLHHNRTHFRVILL